MAGTKQEAVGRGNNLGDSYLRCPMSDSTKSRSLRLEGQGGEQQMLECARLRIPGKRLSPAGSPASEWEVGQRGNDGAK